MEISGIKDKEERCVTTQRTALLGTKSSKQDFKDFRGMFGITVVSWKPVEITYTRFTNVFCVP